MALEGVFGNMGEKERERAFSVCFVEWGKEAPHRHDMNMEGRERTWRERKERTRERKGKERCQDFPVFSQAGVHQVHVPTCTLHIGMCKVFQESKSRFIEGIEGIEWHYRTASPSIE